MSAEPSVETSIRYVVAGEKSVFYAADRARSYWPPDEHRVRIHSMRPEAQQLAIDRNGFVLVREPTAVKNFYDPDEVKRVYYPEVQEARVWRTRRLRRSHDPPLRRRNDRGRRSGTLAHAPLHAGESLAPDSPGVPHTAGAMRCLDRRAHGSQ
jgi:hypothetical protein